MFPTPPPAPTESPRHETTRGRSRVPSPTWWLLGALVLLGCSNLHPSPKTQARKKPEPPPRAAELSPRGPIRPPLFPDLRETNEALVGGPFEETASAYDFSLEDEELPPLLEGTAPIPAFITRSLARYLDVRRARLAALTSDERSMLVLTRIGETTQAHLVERPLGSRTQVTFGFNPVQQVSFAVGDPDVIYFRKDSSGTENFQIFRSDLKKHTTSLLTDGKSRHGSFSLLKGDPRLLFTSNTRRNDSMELTVSDGLTPGSVRTIGEQTGQNVLLSVSRDGKRALLSEFLSRSRSSLRLAHLEDGRIETLAEAIEGISYKSAVFAPDGDQIFVVTNRDRDFLGAYRYRISTGAWNPVGKEHAWDVDEFALSPDGLAAVINFNEAGESILRWTDLRTGQQTQLRRIPAGVVSGLRFVRGGRLAFTLSTTTDPGDAYTYDIQRAELIRWTKSELGGIPPQKFIAPRLIQVESFDGLSIPALYYRPRGEGPFPVLLWMHGGPEEQTRPVFDPIVQYFAAERGIAVIAPNVRGSEGYGQRFMSLDDGYLRMHAVKDVGAVLDFIEREPELDAKKVGIFGGSYGGFLVLASLIEFGDRFAAGSDLVGISNFVTFLENTSSYRRDVRRPEYGDERDPQMREFLLKISPLTRADRIRVPLFVAHGATDPRVPVQEAQAIVDAVRNNGQDVWFMVARDEGHNFRKRKNRDLFYRLLATFFETHLRPTPQETPSAAQK